MNGASTSWSRDLSAFAAGLTYENVPAHVIANARLRLLDTIGVCFASVGMDYAEAIRGMIEEQGAGTAVTMFGSGRAAAAWGALYNGALAHGNDYDDTHSVALIHISGVVIPTVVAMGERCGASGAEVLTAAVAAYETGLRIGIATPTGFHERGFHATGVCGAYAAAIGAAKVLKLDAERMAQALGIVGSQASGLLEFLSDGAWVKRLHPGWAAHAGIVAAQLAARGYIGATAVLEGRYGLYNAYSARPLPDRAALFARLGTEWETLNTDFKPYPCGHLSHPYMDCARDLRTRHKLAPDDIVSIELRVPRAAVPILCEPRADKLRPQNAYAARFSLPYAVAVVLLLGRAGIDEFSEERIRDPQILALAARTSYVVDDSLPFPQAFPGWVKLKLRDGRDVEQRMDASRGSRAHPMSDAEMREKFIANISRRLSPAKAQTIWDAGSRLEAVADIREFTALLSAQ